MDLIKNYFFAGYNLFLDQINLSLSEVYGTFNLIVVIDILLLAVLLCWLWLKIRRTSLVKIVPGFLGLLVLILLSKFLGLISLFYTLVLLLVVLLVAVILIYSQDVQKLIETSVNGHDQRSKIRPLGQHEISNFVRDLTDTVIALSKSQVSSLLVIKTIKPMGRLIENGTALRTEFNKDFVIDIFSHRSKLSSGAIIIDSGMIVSAGSTLTYTLPKKFVFGLANPALRQAALHWEAIVIVTYRNTDYVSLLYKDNSYAKLATNNLERVLKTILMPK